ncbi:MAG: hypothetical protein HFF30_08075 [Flavonifractor sp.]|nr:hypothetical protein [Flavonifractor sp.]MCI9425506.1 hypothetical protein [Flavonifractor sp.]
MAKLVRKSPVPLYGAAAVWAVWGLLLPMYALWHLLAAAGLSVLAALVLRKVFPDTVLTVPDPPPEPVSTGNPEIDALIDQRDKALLEMRRLNDAIADEKISQQIDRMEKTTQAIFTHVAEHPQKLPQIRRFLNYYLPTTLKLLNAYDRMDSAGVAGANIDGTMGKIESMLDTVAAAYDKQLDALFADEALDISAEITVMEQMLCQEGLSGQNPMGGR